MTVGNVDQTLCKQKETVLLLYGTNGEKIALNQPLDLPFTANKVNLVPRVFHLTAPWSERGKTLAHAGHVSPRILEMTIKLLEGWAA